MRLIDADKAISDYAHYGISHSYDAYDLENILTECPTIEAIPKDQYEARLKDDMVAILTEIQEQLVKQYYINRRELHDDFANIGIEQASNIVEDKIYALKGENDNERFK